MKTAAMTHEENFGQCTYKATDGNTYFAVIDEHGNGEIYQQLPDGGRLITNRFACYDLEMVYEVELMLSVRMEF